MMLPNNARKYAVKDGGLFGIAYVRIRMTTGPISHEPMLMTSPLRITTGWRRKT